LPAPLQNLCK